MTPLIMLLQILLLEAFLMKPVLLCDEYKIGFNEGFSCCKDFKNEMFKADSMQLGKSDEDGEDAMYLEGYIEFLEAIQEGYMFDIEIAKETEVGSEPMWSCSMDVCKSLDDTDAPWSASMQSMNLKGCPIETGEYYCKNLTLDMSFMKDKMSHEFEGSYDVMMKIKDKAMETISCHKMGIAISPVDDCK